MTCQLHPVLLRFDDSLQERRFQCRARDAAAKVDPSTHRRRLVAAVVFFAALTYRRHRNGDSTHAVPIMQYITVSALQNLCSRQAWYGQYRAVFILLFEIVYLTLCIVYLPTWHLHPVQSAAGFWKLYILGSGVFLVAWFAMLGRRPWTYDIWLIPVEQAVLHMMLTPLACTALEQTAVGSRFMRWLCDIASFASYTTLLVPTPYSPSCSCSKLLSVWHALWCACTWCAKYLTQLVARQGYVYSHNLDVRWPNWMDIPLAKLVLASVMVIVHCFALSWVML